MATTVNVLLHIALEDVLQHAVEHASSNAARGLASEAEKEELIYQQKVFLKVAKWEERRLRVTWVGSATQTLERWLGALLGYMTPNAIKSLFTNAVLSALTRIENTSMSLIHKPEPNPLPLREQKLSVLDAAAKKFARPAYVVTMLQSACLGVGGAVVLVAEVPALLAVNFRVLAHLANIYGFDPDTPFEREVLLYIVMLSTMSSATDQSKSQSTSDSTTSPQGKTDVTVAALDCSTTYERLFEACYHRSARHLELDGGEPAAREGMNQMIGSLIPSQAVAHAIAVAISAYLARIKLLQLLPWTGSAVAMGVNLYYTVNTAAMGLMIYRKRWLMRQHQVFEGVRNGTLPMPVSYVLVKNSGLADASSQQQNGGDAEVDDIDADDDDDTSTGGPEISVPWDWPKFSADGTENGLQNWTQALTLRYGQRPILPSIPIASASVTSSSNISSSSIARRSDGGESINSSSSPNTRESAAAPTQTPWDTATHLGEALGLSKGGGDNQTPLSAPSAQSLRTTEEDHCAAILAKITELDQEWMLLPLKPHE